MLEYIFGNRHRREKCMHVLNCKNYYVSLCGLKKHQQACIKGVYRVCFYMRKKTCKTRPLGTPH